MSEWDTPEMVRLPLEQSVLRLKCMGVNMVHTTLCQALVPPPPTAIDAAMQQLLNAGAITKGVLNG